MKIGTRFLRHNKTSPIVSSAWLDKNKEHPKGPPETWVWSRKTLADGTIYDIPAAEVEQMRKAGNKIRWSDGRGGIFEV